MSENTTSPGPILSATPRPGALTRCYKATCAICRRTQTVDANDKDHDAKPQLRDLGWKETTHLTEDDHRHWICPKHRESGSYKIYRDKEAERRVELGPGDVQSIG